MLPSGINKRFASSAKTIVFNRPQYFIDADGQETSTLTETGREMDTDHCSDMNVGGRRRAESDSQFFDRVNNQLATYQGLMRGSVAFFQPPLQQLNTLVMTKKGIFAVSMVR